MTLINALSASTFALGAFHTVIGDANLGKKLIENALLLEFAALATQLMFAYMTQIKKTG
jgi:hypothetical protein